MLSSFFIVNLACRTYAAAILALLVCQTYEVLFCSFSLSDLCGSVSISCLYIERESLFYSRFLYDSLSCKSFYYKFLLQTTLTGIFTELIYKQFSLFAKASA